MTPPPSSSRKGRRSTGSAPSSRAAWWRPCWRRSSPSMARGKAAPGVFLIAGADPRLADEALEELLVAALGAQRDHGLEALRGDETTWGKVLETVRTGSLF